MSIINSNPLSANSWWSSPVINFQFNDYKDYKCVRVKVYSDVACTLHLFVSNDVGQTMQEVGVLPINAAVGGNLSLRPTLPLFQAKVQNGSSNATITDIQIDFLEDEIMKPLCDNNGIPISSLNPLNVQMNSLTDLNVNLHDKDGTGLISANGALATYFTNGTISTYTRDGYGNQITSTVEATGHSLNTHLTNDNIAVRLFDGNNQVLTSQNNCLNTNVVNTPNVNIANTPNVNIAGGTVYAGIQNPYLVTRLNDGQGNMLLSAGNKLLTICTNTVSVADSSGNALNSTNNALNVHTTNPFMISRISDASGTPIITTNGGLKIADYHNDLLNNVYNSGFGTSTTLNKLICYRESIPTTGADITTNTNNAYNWSVFPTQIKISSSSINDISAGTGATQITVEGIDATGEATTGIYTMNGTSFAIPVVAQNFQRINNAYVSQAGSIGSNDGKITIFANDGTTEISNIQPSIGVLQNSQLSMSTTGGFIAFLRRCNVQASPLNPVNIYFKIRKNGSAVWKTVESCYCAGIIKKDLCLSLNAGDDFSVFGKSVSSTSTVAIQIEYILTN